MNEVTDPLVQGLVALPTDFSARALVVGCGTGRTTKLLANLGYCYHACDACHENVAATAALMREPVGDRIRQGDMLALPYPDDYFHLVLACGVFHDAYARDLLAEAVNETARVLAPGGHLYADLFVRGSSNLADQRLGVLDPRACAYLTEAGLRMTLVPPRQLERMFEAAGLNPARSTVQAEETCAGRRDVYRGWLIKS